MNKFLIGFSAGVVTTLTYLVLNERHTNEALKDVSSAYSKFLYANQNNIKWVHTGKED